MSAPRRRSRDHILPQARGGQIVIHGDVRNIEEMCQSCNSLRAACGHCWGVVACVRAVAHSEDAAPHVILRRWAMHTIIPVEMAEDREARRVRLTADQLRKEKSAEAVKIGMIVDRIGVDEFVWPADTPAKRVWNLVTLASRGRRY